MAALQQVLGTLKQQRLQSEVNMLSLLQNNNVFRYSSLIIVCTEFYAFQVHGYDQKRQFILFLLTLQVVFLSIRI